MPVTAGTYTVGGVGADYATWQAALADIDTTNPEVGLTGDLTFQQTGPTVEYGTAAIPSMNFNGYYLILETDGYKHSGCMLNVGRQIVFSHTLHGFDFSAALDSIYMKIRDLYTYRFTGAVGSEAEIYFDVVSTSIGHVQLHDCILWGYFNGRFGLRVVGDSTHTAYAMEVWNLLVTEFDYDGITLPMDEYTRLEHCTVMFTNRYCYNFLFSAASSGFCSCYNNIAHNGFTADWFNHSNVRGYHNSSSDLTAANANWWASAGVNNITSVPFTDFKDVQQTEKEFGVPTITGAFYGAGRQGLISHSDITHDIQEHPYPRTKSYTTQSPVQVYTIGAFQLGALPVDAVDVTDDIQLNVLVQLTGEDTLEISEDDTTIRAKFLSGSDILAISETPDVRADFVITAQDDLEINDPGDYVAFYEPDCNPIILRGRVNLWYPAATLANQLVLPQPIDDDEYSLDTRVNPRHTKGGDLRVYKRGAVLHVLQMNFVVDKGIRDLCLYFFELSSSQLIRMFDWEGRMWHGVIINTPITFQAQGKANETEDFAFTLEFEGWQI